MVNTNNTFVSKHQLLDYISKRDFNDFVAEMRDFRSLTETRFNSIDARFNTIEARLAEHDKRFDKIDRQIDELKEIIRVHTGALLDQFREDLKMGLEYVQHVDNKKVDLVEFEKLKGRVDLFINSVNNKKEA